MIVNRTQTFFILIFVILNAAIFIFAEVKIENGVSYHPVYWNASDGQRYWGAAQNLATTGKFLVTYPQHGFEEPLKRAGPLPALLFAGPIKAFGLTGAAPLIVAIQCIFLYLAGWSSRQL